MEYVQERVTTLHDFGDAAPEAPTEHAAVVVPMTERDHGKAAAARVFSALEVVDPARVVVALRADAEAVPTVAAWLDSFELPLELLWCDGPRLAGLLSEGGLDGARGKGRDVWLAVGLASDADSVVVHDADARGYDERIVPKLLFPLTRGYEFSKGYYARLEDGRLYGRLFRLLFRPLLEALSGAHDEPILEYLAAFRYALAGEFAVSGRLARELRFQRGWGLEVGTLGEAHRLVGAEGSAQVDLGVHEHDHRSVTGSDGLAEMAGEVVEALCRAAADGGVDPDYATLPDRYKRAAERLVDAYATDAAFNGLQYDLADELRQVGAYADAIAPPGRDARLPAWCEAPIVPADVADAAGVDLSGVAADVDAVNVSPRSQ